MNEPEDYRFGARSCRCCGRDLGGDGACVCAVHPELRTPRVEGSGAANRPQIGAGTSRMAVEREPGGRQQVSLQVVTTGPSYAPLYESGRRFLGLVEGR